MKRTCHHTLCVLVAMMIFVAGYSTPARPQIWTPTSNCDRAWHVYCLLEASDGYLYAGTGNYGYVFRANTASGYSAVANAEASVYGDKSLTASGSLNALALLAIPAGVVIALRLWRRKK